MQPGGVNTRRGKAYGYDIVVSQKYRTFGRSTHYSQNYKVAVFKDNDLIDVFSASDSRLTTEITHHFAVIVLDDWLKEQL